jgi:hypothetical protein
VGLAARAVGTEEVVTVEVEKDWAVVEEGRAVVVGMVEEVMVAATGVVTGAACGAALAAWRVVLEGLAALAVAARVAAVRAAVKVARVAAAAKVDHRTRGLRSHCHHRCLTHYARSGP